MFITFYGYTTLSIPYMVITCSFHFLHACPYYSLLLPSFCNFPSSAPTLYGIFWYFVSFMFLAGFCPFLVHPLLLPHRYYIIIMHLYAGGGSWNWSEKFELIKPRLCLSFSGLVTTLTCRSICQSYWLCHIFDWSINMSGMSINSWRKQADMIFCHCTCTQIFYE